MNDLLSKFEHKLNKYPQEDRKRIISSARWSRELHGVQKRASGEPYFIHPLQVADILVDMKIDADSVIAALLHDIIEDTTITRQDLIRKYGRQVESLVDGVTKISILRAKSKSVQEAESIRKMLFAMVKDIRVILIKLADKLHNMRTLQYLPEEKRRTIAKECLDIYAPLAGRLGISWMKTELEDLSLKHLSNETYYQIKEFVTQKKNERAEYLDSMVKMIYREASGEGMKIKVYARAKHFYSIYMKMKHGDKMLDEIYDLLGIRVLCKTQNECYTLLGLIHKIWIPIEGRFKDYIAMPKANKYQSLHTTVMGEGGKPVEIQIRTYKMHSIAEFGIAAHWVYKSRVPRNRLKPRDLAIITKLKSWNGMKIPSRDFLDEIKRELLEDSIYLFTPQGDIIELPRGSTAIDFAYHIHTEVGHHTVGAKADGAIIPLNKELKNTQVIEILTAGNGRPHINWYRQVKTSSARSKIRHWLNKYDDSIILEKSIIAKKKPAPPPEPEKEPVQQEAPGQSEEIVKRVMDFSKVAFKIGGEKNIMIRLAQCCSPSTGDAIIGYVSRGRGIIVHKRQCPNLTHIKEFDERNIMVEWETVSPKTTSRFKVTAHMTSDLFSEIEGAIRKYRGHLIEGKLEEDDKGHLTGFFTVELETRDDFNKVKKSIRTIPSVMNIQPMSLQSAET